MSDKTLYKELAGVKSGGEAKPETPPALRNAVEWVVSTSQGREFMNELLKFCGMELSSFSTDPVTMGRSEGKRTVGLKVQRWILDADPGAWIKMEQEKQEHERRKRDTRNGAGQGNAGR